MSAMLTPKREAFAQAYVDCGSPTEAYRRVYATDGWKPTSIEATAGKLIALPIVSLRVAEIRSELAKRNALSHDWVIERLKANHEAAYEAGDYTASNQALKLIGQHLGMWAKREIEISGQIDVHVHEQLTALRGLSVETLRGFVAPKLLAPPTGEES